MRQICSWAIFGLNYNTRLCKYSNKLTLNNNFYYTGPACSIQWYFLVLLMSLIPMPNVTRGHCSLALAFNSLSNSKPTTNMVWWWCGTLHCCRKILPLQEGQGSQPQSSASETGRKCSLAQGLSRPVAICPATGWDYYSTHIRKTVSFLFFYYYFKLNRLQHYYQALQKCAAHTGAI